MTVEPLNRDLRERLRMIPTASLSDTLDGFEIRGFMSNEVRPLLRGVRIVGPAVTIKDVSSVEREAPLLALEALSKAPQGAVVVRSVEGFDAKDVALWGGSMSLTSKTRGLEGAVLDGGARDVRETLEMQFPVFSRSIIPSTSVGRTKVKDINVPIHCAGVLVRPGDIIVGDDDGVIVVPKDIVEEAVAGAEELEYLEASTARELKKGRDLIDVVREFKRV